MMIKVDATPVVAKLTEAQNRFRAILQELEKGGAVDLKKVKVYATQGMKRTQQAGLALSNLHLTAK